MTDWAARIIDPEAFDGSLTCGITFVRQEFARTKARAIVDKAREEWIAYADKLEKVLELVAEASTDELKKMQAKDGLQLVRPANPSEQT